MRADISTEHVFLMVKTFGEDQKTTFDFFKIFKPKIDFACFTGKSPEIAKKSHDEYSKMRLGSDIDATNVD